MPEPKEQGLFDTLLANGIKMIYKEGVAEKLVEGIDERVPQAGIISGTQMVMGKLDQVAAKQGSRIPTKMRPDLIVELSANITDAAKTAGKDVPDEALACTRTGRELPV